MQQLKTAFSILLIATSLLFVLQNMSLVTVSFVIWELTLPRAVLLALVFGLGFTLAWLLQRK